MTSKPSLDVEIARCKAAILRLRARMEAIIDRIDAEGGAQSAHEHDAEWKALADKLERSSAWFCILLRKRGRAEDERLAAAAEMSAWP